MGGQPPKLGADTSNKPQVPIENVSPVPLQPAKPDYASELEIDVSHYEPVLDYRKTAAEGRVKRVYVKVTEHAVDSLFVAHTKAAQAAGLRCGGYHFFHPSEDGAVQAQRYIDAVEKAGIKFELPHCLDWEVSDGQSSAKQQLEANKWLSVVEKHFGSAPEIYGGESFLSELKLAIGFARYPLWLAHYQTTFARLHIPFPWKRVQGWQYTDAETVAGLQPGHHVDASWVYNG